MYVAGIHEEPMLPKTIYDTHEHPMPHEHPMQAPQSNINAIVLLLVFVSRVA